MINPDHKMQIPLIQTNAFIVSTPILREFLTSNPNTSQSTLKLSPFKNQRSSLCTINANTYHSSFLSCSRKNTFIQLKSSNSDDPPSSSSESNPKESESLIEQEINDIRKVILWVLASVPILLGIYFQLGSDRAAEFLAAYVVEYSLSVDNLFVFLLLFQYFKVPRKSQEKVLNYGIIGAASMRLAFIVVGEALEKRFEWVSLIFSFILIVSAVQIFVSGGDDDEDEDLSGNSIVQFSKSLLSFSEKYDGDKFWSELENGAKVATPLLLTLICVELSDVVFALDSVPAVLGISDNTFVIYSSNLMAILGLRSLFFVVEDAVANLRFLQPCLGAVLAFVGVKLGVSVFGYTIDTTVSLGIILALLSTGVGLSYAFPENKSS